MTSDWLEMLILSLYYLPGPLAKPFRFDIKNHMESERRKIQNHVPQLEEIEQYAQSNLCRQEHYESGMFKHALRE